MRCTALPVEIIDFPDLSWKGAAVPMYVYSTGGLPVGFVHDAIIHDMEGFAVGRLVGSRVHRLDGSYVGEFFKEMVVLRADARPRSICACRVPPPRSAPEAGHRRKVVIDYGYPDVFHLLGRGQHVAADDPAIPTDEAEEKGSETLNLDANTSWLTRAAEPEVILLVDDEPKVRETIRHALTALGFRVQEASSGKEAIESFDASRPQLVILDFLMPDMDGAEVAREVMKMDPDVPIVFSTGHSALRALRNAAGNEVPVIPKPFTVSQLDNFLSDVLAEARKTALVLST